MERSIVIVIVLGLVAAAGLYLVSPYLSLIVLVIAAVVAASFAISRDAVDLPDIAVTLAEDARSIVLRNSGNATALQVHASIVPVEIEFDLPSLGVEAIHEEPLPGQVTEVKAIVTFKNSMGQSFQRVELLSALRPEADPLRPTFPIFGWR